MTRTTATTAVLMIVAVSVVAALGVLAGISPEFKARATLAAVIALAGLVACGLVIAVIGRYLRYFVGPHTGPLRASQNTATTTAAASAEAFR